MEFSLHIEKVDPDERWKCVHEIAGEVLARFISYRDEATLGWFAPAGGGGLRLVPALGSAIARPEDFRRCEASPLLEIRQYRVATGQRDRFAKFFAGKCVPALTHYGLAVHGQFEDLDDPNDFVWLRGFPDMVERDRRKMAFYQSKLWLDELQDEAFSMIEDYSRVLLVAPVTFP